MYIPSNGYYQKAHWLQVPWSTFKSACGTATSAQVLKSKTFTSESGIKISGTMVDYSSGYSPVTASGKWGFDTKDGAWLYIPENAYYGTSHWLNIPWNTIKNSCGNATASQILSGYTATSANGIKISGTNKGYDAGYSAGVSAKTSKYKAGTATMSKGGYINVGFQPNLILVKGNVSGSLMPVGVYSTIGYNFNVIEGQSNTHVSNSFYTDANGFGWSSNVKLDYADGRAIFYVAARIV